MTWLPCSQIPIASKSPNSSAYSTSFAVIFVIPSVYTYVEKLADTAAAKKSVVADVSVASEVALISKLSTLADTMATDLETLKADTAKALASSDDVLACSKAYQETVLEDMEALRKSADEAEALIPDELLPYPTYDELLFSI